MARESSLWAWLSKARLEFGDDLHMNRVENAIMAGMADVEGFLRLRAPVHATHTFGAQFWIELKSEERPARHATPVRFKFKKREAQIEWMRRRYEIGANAFFLLQVGSHSEAMRYLAPGNHGSIISGGMTEAELAVLCVNSGVFTARSKPSEILKRVVRCRSNR